MLIIAIGIALAYLMTMGMKKGLTRTFTRLGLSVFMSYISYLMFMSMTEFVDSNKLVVGLIVFFIVIYYLVKTEKNEVSPVEENVIPLKKDNAVKQIVNEKKELETKEAQDVYLSTGQEIFVVAAIVVIISLIVLLISSMN